MKSFLHILIIFCSTTLVVKSQTWTSVSPDILINHTQEVLPGHFAAMQMQQPAAEDLADRVAYLPLPDGSLHPFTLSADSNFDPALSARFPRIQSYRIQSQQKPLWRGRLSVSPQGWYAVINHEDGEIYIDPITSEGKTYYLSYHTRDDRVSPEERAQYQEHEHHFVKDPASFLNEKPVRSPFARKLNNDPVELITYRLALACSGEYTQSNGGTKEGALSAMNNALDRINFVLETELSIKLELIPETEELIFLDGSTDPYTNGNAGQMALENNNHLIAALGTASYDVGHVFGTQCSGVVGTSGGVGIACGSLKGFGSSCQISRTDRFYIGVVCHELGHQFGAEHTWNNCPTAPDNQFSSGTAFEPGSGTTIMSYAGACANQNIQDREDFYYHNNSLESIMTFTREGGGRCGEIIPTENRRPTINILHPDDFYIPIRTPFKLTAQGSDPDGDEVTYSWEQYDAGIGAAAMNDLNDPRGDAPIFRSAPPDLSPTRYFPALPKIIRNEYDNTEVLPTYDRKLTFRATARDQQLGGGGVAWDEMVFRATASAGPFLVNDEMLKDTITTGSYIPIQWEVAGTDQAPVSCRYVNILMSKDGGQTFTDTLLAQTPNDGTENVLIPEGASESARIMVEAADNVFFAINNKDLVIESNPANTFALDLLPHDQSICLPGTGKISINSFALGSFNEPISLSLVQQPEGVSVSLPEAFIPGEPIEFNLDFTRVTQADTFTLTFQAIGNNGDTIVRDINVQTISNDFSDLVLVSPEPGISGIGIRPTFAWTGSEQAAGYHLEISESPAFSNAISIDGLTGLEASLDTALEENTLYYWRIQPFNQCGTGDYTTTAAFHSLNLACETFTPDDLPRNISQSVIVPIQSTIEVSQTGIVEDVNVRSINGFHEAFGDLVFKLAGPLGDTVTLLSRQCGFSSRQFTLGFDSESTLSFGCQSSFQGQIYMPQDSLNRFKGSSIEGDWSLIVIDSMIGSGGAVNQWELELCGSLAPVAPEFSILDTIEAFYDQITTIDNQYLQVIDDASTAEQLIYTLVSPTAAGDLLLDGNALTVGEQFSQAMVDARRLEYRHAGLDSLPDAFVCTVIDGSGGWIAPTAIPISVSQETVSAQDLIRRWDLKVFPNPATDHLTITWSGLPSEEIEYFRLRDVQGRIILAGRMNGQTTFETGHLTRGTYFAQIIGKDGTATVKVVLL